MIFDIYEQSDLFAIAKCGWRSTLERWLEEKGIPYAHDAQGNVIAHRKAVEAGLGVQVETQQADTEPKLYLGEEDAA